MIDATGLLSEEGDVAVVADEADPMPSAIPPAEPGEEGIATDADGAVCVSVIRYPEYGL